MKSKLLTLSVLIASACGGSAFAQTTYGGSPAPATSPTMPQTTIEAAPTGATGADAASAPFSRAAVKAQTKAAVKNGELPTGEGVAGERKPKKASPKKTASEKTRDQVKAEAESAAKTDEPAKSEPQLKTKP